MKNPQILSWENITIETKTKRKTLKILQNVSGRATAGRMHIFMGPSGAGKSTLINTLMGHVPFEFKTSGKILLDDKERPNDFKTIVGFSDQQDVYFDYYTVEDFLLFHSKGKNRDISTLESLARIDTLLKRMHLEGKRDTVVSKLSGGERKRLILISELMTNKKIIFLDEPTSGLDSHLALGLIRYLKELTIKENLLMFVTLQQPSPTIVNMFDDFTFIVWGKVLYHGEYSKCEEYFTNHGFIKPSNITFTEYLFELTAEQSSFDEISPNLEKLKSLLPEDAPHPLKSSRSYYLNDYRCSFSVISALLKRELKNYFKNIRPLSIIFMLIFLGLYFNASYHFFIALDFFKEKSLQSGELLLSIIGMLVFFSFFYSIIIGIVLSRNVNFALKNKKLLISEVKNNSYTSLELLATIFIMNLFLSLFFFLVILLPFGYYNFKLFYLLGLYFFPCVPLSTFISTIFIFGIPIFSTICFIIVANYGSVITSIKEILKNNWGYSTLTEDYKTIFQLLAGIFSCLPNNFYSLCIFKSIILSLISHFGKSMDEEFIKNKFQFIKIFSFLSGLDDEISKSMLFVGAAVSLSLVFLLVWNSYRYINSYTSLAYRYKLEK